MEKTPINRLSLFFTGLILFSIWMISCNKEHVAIREKIQFNESWKFVLSDSSEFSNTSFNDSQWRLLNLPHDWSIEGKFSEDSPSGVGGGALPGGTGWYRKSFNLSELDLNKRIYITFDGVYKNSEVYINGNLIGKRPNGYISFQYDLTPYLNYGQKSNVLAVRVDNSDQPNSRWYSGSGIYRNVWLEKTNAIHIDLWGTYITTHAVTKESAEVEVSIVLKNTTSINENLQVETKLFDGNNKMVSAAVNQLTIKQNDTTELKQTLHVTTPKLWSIEDPSLYRAISTIKLNNKEIDVYETTFGIRYFEFDKDQGFILNGKPTKILGVCNHHDLGALGTAVNTRAIERQLEILKEMGCNGIRTSHNPPSPELLDLCDKMGFIVQDESFDVWAKKKVEFDYAQYWDEWHERDLKDHLLRDRNHPSVFSWSIGNEILEQWDSTGISIARELAGIVHKYAPGIPITSGLNGPTPDNFIYQSGALDLVGFNYHHEDFVDFQRDFKDQIFIATETTSSLNSRGEYQMPGDSIFRWPYRWDLPFYDGNQGNWCSSYDNCCAPWGSTHAATWNLIKKYNYLSGMYIWTGFDYLGEPTPYEWPSRSSYFGIIDLAGFPKDAYYMYQSEWTNKPVLHLFPHWNWESGQKIDLWVYSNYEEVELFVNGKSQGVKTKNEDGFHSQWSVVYEPGSIKAIGKNANGQSEERIINTAGATYKIKLSADRESILADNADLAFITIEILDKDNNPVPHADNLVKFEVSDLMTIAGVDNGSQTSHESFKADSRTAFNGKCLLIVQSKKEKGNALIKATSPGLESASLNINLR
ncbi:MAG: glycoside hydrolase family 2 [Bacteroidetes bacterium CG18_big_fil_WC_8_21_14_2_50_41_14]|nr:MAG: glycoside hydrolase family 2 [Bacteroidetes bacterium CG18_big_fil_WC_8_21_14_2_50_41_14]PJB55174.1 MAG: glycoside hydrolase family 2 [Bacteroidetes bacterium CG_4_9_14_3_um_filter_41_19]